MSSPSILGAKPLPSAGTSPSGPSPSGSLKGIWDVVKLNLAALKPVWDYIKKPLFLLAACGVAALAIVLFTGLLLPVVANPLVLMSVCFLVGVGCFGMVAGAMIWSFYDLERVMEEQRNKEALDRKNRFHEEQIALQRS